MASLSLLLVTAALAVVLVLRHVEDTGDRVSNPDLRVTWMARTAFDVELAAMAAAAGDFDAWAGWERHFTEQCGLIAVLHAGADVRVVENRFGRALGGGGFGSAAGYAAAGDERPATAGKARVVCRVG